MKFAAIIASANAIMLQSDIKLIGDPITVTSANDDPFIEVPMQKITLQDSPWGHEVQRVGHQDWLDTHVKTVKEIFAGVPPKAEKEDRVAVYDS